MSLVRDDKKANVTAAKAVAYAERGELSRAHEVLTQTRYGPVSRADEFNKVKAMIERRLAEPEPMNYNVRAPVN
jgi:hypothetical protein